MRTLLTDLISIKYPLIQGGMANIATHTFAAAVSNAGGLGIIGTGGWDAMKAREEIRACKQLTIHPFGVNIMLMNPHASAIAQVVIEENVPVVTTGAGNPGPYMNAWKEAGILVIPVVPSVALGIRMQRAGADAVIAEGTEAGGHVGELTTMALIPQMADALSIPVIAAGGIADRRQVLAAFALGASGIQVGTILLASDECPIHLNYKTMLIQAKDTATVVTGRHIGAPVRVLKNQMTKKYMQMTLKEVSRDELEILTLGSMRKAVLDGNLDEGSFMAGQVAGMITCVRPVQTIINDLFYQTDQWIKDVSL